MMSAVKAGMSGCRCSHMGCHITKPLARRKVRSDSWRGGNKGDGSGGDAEADPGGLWGGGGPEPLSGG